MGTEKREDRRDFIDHTSASSCVNSDFRLQFATLDIQNIDKRIFRIFSDSFVISVRITDEQSMMNRIDLWMNHSRNIHQQKRLRSCE